MIFKRTMADRDALPLPLEVRARLAELELELSEGKNKFTVHPSFFRLNAIVENMMPSPTPSLSLPFSKTPPPPDVECNYHSNCLY